MKIILDLKLFALELIDGVISFIVVLGQCLFIFMIGLLPFTGHFHNVAQAFLAVLGLFILNLFALSVSKVVLCLTPKHRSQTE